MSKSDPRLGLPSASEMDRLYFCPGSLAMSRKAQADGMSFRAPVETEWADSGSRSHREMEDGLPASDMAVELERQRKRMYRHLFPDSLRKAMRPRPMKERRMWFSQGGQKLFSGQADWMSLARKAYEIIISDYKTGWGEQRESSSNMQLRSLVVLAGHNFKVKKAHAVLIQPNAGEPDWTTYEEDDIKAATDQVLNILAEARRPNAYLNPGIKQCRFCPARFGTCHALNSLRGSFADTQKSTLEVTQGHVLGKLMDQWKTLEPTGKAVQNIVRSRLESDGIISGWCLTPQKPGSEFTDLIGLRDYLIEKGVVRNESEFMEMVSITKGKLDEKINQTVKGGDTTSMTTHELWAGISQFTTPKERGGRLTKAKEGE